MKTAVKWAELHSPLFLAGTNLGQKLDPTKRSGLSMEYDEDKRHLYVSYNEHTARVPETAVLSLVEGVIEKPKVAIAPAKPIKAQVSTPQDHVFAGVGAGDTGQKPKMKF